MLSRYQMRRGAKASELPDGIRQDTRKHTRHILRPHKEDVAAFLGGELPWESFAERYRALVASRMADDRAPFDALAELATMRDVYLGCSCPTRAQPHVHRCHTWIALTVMQSVYPDLEVRFPEE